MSEASHSFEAHAFHPDASNEVAEGRIVIDRCQFHFQSETINLEIPLARLNARTGEGEDERIYFSDPANPGWEIYTLDERVPAHPFLGAASGVRDQLGSEATRREVTRRLKQLAWVVGVCFVLVWLGQLAVSAMVRSLVARVPPEMEQKLGDAVMLELQDELVFIEEPKRVAHLTALAAPLTDSLGAQGTNFQFYIAYEKTPNAFALPGGHVIVTTGLLDACDRPEQLLGVVAHELAHVTEKHGIRKAIASAGPFLIFRVFLGGGGRGFAGMLGQASDLLVRSGFSQEYETEADETGWRLLMRAKLDPRGMTEMFEKLHAYEVAQEKFMNIPEAFSSHPAMTKRIARLEKKWRALPQKEGFVDVSPLTPRLRAAAGH